MSSKPKTKSKSKSKSKAKKTPKKSQNEKEETPNIIPVQVEQRPPTPFITTENGFKYTYVELFHEEDIKKISEESNQKNYISKIIEEHLKKKNPKYQIQ